MALFGALANALVAGRRASIAGTAAGKQDRAVAQKAADERESALAKALLERQRVINDTARVGFEGQRVQNDGTRLGYEGERVGFERERVGLDKGKDERAAERDNYETTQRPVAEQQARAELDRTKASAAASRASAQRTSTPTTDKPVVATQGERKFAGLLEIARSATPIIDGAPTPSRMARTAAQLGLNEVLDDSQQKVEQAGLMLADAYIRFTSGANAPEPEVKRTFRMITPMPGDSPATRERKKEARQTILRAMEIGAGRSESAVTPAVTPAATPTPAAVEPRKPGESPAAYLARTRGR